MRYFNGSILEIIIKSTFVLLINIVVLLLFPYFVFIEIKHYLDFKKKPEDHINKGLFSIMSLDKKLIKTTVVDECSCGKKTHANDLFQCFEKTINKSFELINSLEQKF